MADINSNTTNSSTTDAIESLHKTMDIFRSESTNNFSEMIKGQLVGNAIIKKSLDKSFEESRRNLQQSKGKDPKATKGAAGAAARAKPSAGDSGPTGKLGAIIKMFAGAGIGLAAAGIGIGGFFMGLAGAEAIMSKFGGGDNLKNLLVNIAAGLKAFDTRDLKALGIVMGAGAVMGGLSPGTAIKGAVGMTAIGAGIGGFMLGISVADKAMTAMGDGGTFKTLSTNIAGGLAAFSSDQLIGLAVVMGAGAVVGGLSPGTALKGAVGMMAIGVGIGGFMAGISAGDALSFGDGTNLNKLMTNVGTGLSSFDPKHLAALAIIMGAGAVVGGAKPGTAIKGAIGMTAIGAGIGGFMAGISAGDALAFGDGANLKTLMENIGAGLKSFDADHLKALAAIAGVGAVVGGISPGLAVKGAIGMTAIGAGIGGFFAGLAGAGDIAGFLSIDGEGIKTIMVNTATGLSAFNDVDGENMKSLGLGLIPLSAGLAALLVTDGVSKLIGGALTGIKTAWNWITGQDSEGEVKESRFKQIADELKHLEHLKVPNIDGPKFKET